MKPLTSILAATDFSAPSRHAAERAAFVAQETGARLTLLHSLPKPALDELRLWLGVGQTAEQQVVADATQRLQQLGHKLGAARHVKVQTQLASGAVMEEIARQGEAVDAGLLVLGFHGASFLRRLVLGTTSERLLRRSTRPLLVIKQAPHERYRRVLVALDFSPWSLPAIELARRVAPHATLVLLAAFELPFDGKLEFAGVEPQTIAHYRRQAQINAREQLDALVQQAGLEPGQWEPCVIEGHAWQRIVEQEQECDCDLIVLGKHGQSAAEALLLGSVTRSVLAESNGDVLVSMAHQA